MSPARLRAYWALAAAVVLGTALRCFHLGANSLWTDELATLVLASHPAGDILRLTSSANFVPPLYFLLVHGALGMLGESEVSLRLLSVIAGVATIPAVWLLTAELTASETTASIAALLLAVNPLHLWFSQEARPYALLLLFGCGALLCLARALRQGRLLDWIGFSVCTALATLTHTTGMLFLAVGWVWVIAMMGRRASVRALLLASAAAVLLCAPFFLAIADALVASRFTFHSPPRALTGLEIPYSLFTYMAGFSFGPGPRDIQNLGALAAVLGQPIESAVAAVAGLAVVALVVLRRQPEMKPFVGMLGVSLLGMVGLAAASGKAYNVRYTLPALVAFLCLLGLALRSLAPQPRALWLTALVGLSLTADLQWFFVPGYWKEDSRAAVAWLRTQLSPGGSVFVAPSYSAQSLAYYAQRSTTDLRFIPLEPDSSLSMAHLPDALVLTRLHHVPNWQELRSEFLGASGARSFQSQVAGYEILLRGSAATATVR